MSRPAFVKLTSVVCSGLILFVVGLSPQKIAAQQLLPFNGFDVAMGLIELADIYYGGPDRDAIPAIDEPRFLAGAARDGQLAKNARVLAVNHNGLAKAYPFAILDQHEIVNDQFAGKPLLITFCPLCGTEMVFTADVGGNRLVL